MVFPLKGRANQPKDMFLPHLQSLASRYKGKEESQLKVVTGQAHQKEILEMASTIR